MSKVSYLILLLIKIKMPDTSICQLCEEYESRMVHKFYPSGFCQKSNLNIIATENSAGLSQCLDLAREKRGMAVNFGRQTSKSSNTTSAGFESCQILECPETDNFTTMENNTEYDYYSMYTNPLPNQNSTCVSGVGVFVLHSRRENYSRSRNICRENGGRLAHILSETRTNGLSNVILTSGTGTVHSNKGLKMAYVGLNDIRIEGQYVTDSEEPMYCFEYRAWAPGHPRNKHEDEDCVVLDGDRSWKVVNCKDKLPFLCEVMGNAPHEEHKQYRNASCSSLLDTE